MRVLLDCRSVFPGAGGIGRATAALARLLPQALPEAQVLLLTGARGPSEPMSPAPNAQEVRVEAGMLDPLFEQVRLPGLLHELEVDLYHGPCFSVPIASSATRVATVHDAVFRRHPELVDEPLRSYLDRWTRVSCDLAEAVVTVSRFSRAEIAALYGRPQERVDLVPNAVDEPFFRLERAKLEGPPYLLYVGALEEKKNVPLLLRGFARLLCLRPELPHVLVLAGGAGGARFDLAAHVSRSGLPQGRLRALGRVSEEDLRRLYSSADAFAYLSQYEGFGLPPLEAMAAGVPALVADRSSLPEVVGGGALLVDPDDETAVARALERLLLDQDLRAELGRGGPEAARQFSWEASARALADVYRRVLADRATRQAA